MIAVKIPDKSALIGRSKARPIFSAAARIAGIDRRTAGDQRMGLSRTAIVVQGTENIRNLNASRGHDIV